MLSHIKQGYREPETVSSLNEPPPTPGLLKWTGQALLSVFTGTPKTDNTRPVKNLIGAGQKLDFQPKSSAGINVMKRADPQKSTTASQNQLTTTAKPSKLSFPMIDSKTDLKQELSTEKKPGILATSTPIAPRRGSNMFKFPTLVDIDEADDSGMTMTMSSPSRKSVAFDEKKDSIMYFKDVSGSSVSNSHASNDDVAANQPDDDSKTRRQKTNKNDPEASIYDMNKSGLPKDFPGRFPKSAITFYPEDASFAATKLSENQTNMLGSLMTMIQSLFINKDSSGESSGESAGEPTLHDEDDVVTLIEGLQQTLDTLKQTNVQSADTKTSSNPQVSWNELQYLRKCEILMSNYRYATSLFAANVADATESQNIKDVLLAVQKVLQSQGSVLADIKKDISKPQTDPSLQKPGAYHQSREEHNDVVSLADVHKLKQYIRDSVRSRSRKVLDLSENESGASNNDLMKKRIKRARDAVYQQLDEPGVKDSLFAALKSFESADRTAMGDIQKHYSEIDSMSVSLLQSMELQEESNSEREVQRVLQEKKQLEKSLNELQAKSLRDQQIIQDLNNQLSQSQHKLRMQQQSPQNEDNAKPTTSKANSNSINNYKGNVNLRSSTVPNTRSSSASVLDGLNAKENYPPTPMLIKPRGYVPKTGASNFQRASTIRDWRAETDLTGTF